MSSARPTSNLSGFTPHRRRETSCGVAVDTRNKANSLVGLVRNAMRRHYEHAKQSQSPGPAHGRRGGPSKCAKQSQTWVNGGVWIGARSCTGAPRQRAARAKQSQLLGEAAGSREQAILAHSAKQSQFAGGLGEKRLAASLRTCETKPILWGKRRDWRRQARRASRHLCETKPNVGGMGYLDKNGVVCDGSPTREQAVRNKANSSCRAGKPIMRNKANLRASKAESLLCNR
jgi:hypothetical protein